MTTKSVPNLRDINTLQDAIMRLVDAWAHQEQTPIPRAHIVERMEVSGVKDCTTVNALNALLRKGYLRRAAVVSNTTSYVMLRRPR